LNKAKKKQQKDVAGQSPGTVNLYVLCALHTIDASAKNGPGDSEPRQMPSSCFAA
jgi:hypothetical protein